ncbi:type II toxin-antitoxin system RelE/ParE family toxin [Leptolyngbya sp. 'hensonii']|nr:type II toxin-antitoxin system RelE/ParE family toxin [Leptolyngbya sp. 'hensonii']
MNSTFQRIAQFPKIGRKRDNLYPGLRSLSYGQHLIFYLKHYMTTSLLLG